MRKSCDEVATLVYAVEIVLFVEEQLGITIPDTLIDNEMPRDQITLRFLTSIVETVLPPGGESAAAAAVASAVRCEFPDAVDPLDMDAPLLDAVCPHRIYEEGYA
jgi:hypothetical protein